DYYCTSYASTTTWLF
nr:immunoglobulin light chain junction region [Macaca mulatta]MOV72818.1 immunoglobulin light chain junction region [Macaca mulatta]MOV73101.1 immunoglobulin light chain junction region [Macaca mulatta]